MRLEKAKSISPHLVLMHLSECYWIFLNIVTSYLILYAQVHGALKKHKIQNEYKNYHLKPFAKGSPVKLFRNWRRQTDRYGYHRPRWSGSHNRHRPGVGTPIPYIGDDCIGTPVSVSRNMGASEMILIGQLTARFYKSKGWEADISLVRNQVEELCHAFPLYLT